MPALPLDEAGKYVVAAYLVFLALILIYVAILAVRIERTREQLGELADLAERRRDEARAQAEEAPAAGTGAEPGSVERAGERR